MLELKYAEMLKKKIDEEEQRAIDRTKKEFIEIVIKQLDVEKQRMVNHTSDNLSYFQGRVYALEDLLQTLWRKMNERES